MAKFIDRFKKAFFRDEKDARDDGEEKQEGRVGREDIKRAAGILNVYKAGKSALEDRLVANERWWKLRQWEYIQDAKNASNRTKKPAGGWLFNSVVQKHADAMDCYPTCNILPREESDTETAKLLSEVLPVVIDRTDFRKTYSEGWWAKLKSGTAVYKAYWDPDVDGIGDIAIEYVDLLNLFWQPGIKDIQKSRNVFHVEIWDNEALKETYGLPDDFDGESCISVREYLHDESENKKDKSAVVDWWYKKRDASGKIAVHFCRFVGDRILYASENDEKYAEQGYYDHGKYPFCFDVLFPEVDMPTGFGYIDVLKDVQTEIDVINNLFSERASKSLKTRYFISKNTNINKADFADDSVGLVEVEGTVSALAEGIKEIHVPEPSAILLNYHNALVDELKEVSGCRDINQGGTVSGVTAASAIAALQEAGSKTSRDATQTSYRAYEQICALVIELIRQFYKTERSFRITGEGAKPSFEKISGDMLNEQKQSITDDDLYVRRAVFDVAISAQKGSPFSRISQNELVKELYQLGVFRPDMADQALLMLEGMEFEGKDALVEKIRENATLKKQVEQLTALVQQTAQALGGTGGEVSVQDAQPPAAASGGVATDTLGGAVTRGSAVVDRARAQAQDAAAPVV